MTVEFFFCQDIEYTSERRAFYRTAKLLHRKFAADPRYFALAGNVTIPGTDLPQVDAILFSESLVAIIDFKNCGDPIQIPENEKATWYAVNSAGQKYMVRGGKAKNPRIQARKTHYAWGIHLQKMATGFLSPERARQLSDYWKHMKGWILFEPRLHPDNRTIPKTRKDALWLSFAGVDEIIALWYAQKSQLRLTPPEIRRVITDVLQADQHSEFDTVFEKTLGHLLVPDADDRILRYPVSRFDTVSIGRSGNCDIHIPRRYSNVSGNHARLITGLESVRIVDDDSTNGTFIDGMPVNRSSTGTLLAPNATVSLGNPSQNRHCDIQFQAIAANNNATPTAITR